MKKKQWCLGLLFAGQMALSVNSYSYYSPVDSGLLGLNWAFPPFISLFGGDSISDEIQRTKKRLATLQRLEDKQHASRDWFWPFCSVALSDNFNNIPSIFGHEFGKATELKDTKSYSETKDGVQISHQLGTQSDGQLVYRRTTKAADQFTKTEADNTAASSKYVGRSIKEVVAPKDLSGKKLTEWLKGLGCEESSLKAQEPAVNTQ